MQTLRPAHTTLDEFENGVFTREMNQMCSVHITLKKLKNTTITSHLCLRKARAGEYQDYRNFIVLEKCLFNIISVHTKTQNRRFHIPFGLKNVFETARFRDGLVLIEGLTETIKLRFQTLPA